MPKMTVKVDFDEWPGSVDQVIAFIPLAKAGLCVNCNRVFTILPGQELCPVCGSVAWGRVKPWLDRANEKKVAEEVA